MPLLLPRQTMPSKTGKTSIMLRFTNQGPISQTTVTTGLLSSTLKHTIQPLIYRLTCVSSTVSRVCLKSTQCTLSSYNSRTIVVIWSGSASSTVASLIRSTKSITLRLARSTVCSVFFLLSASTFRNLPLIYVKIYERQRPLQLPGRRLS